MKGRSKYYKWRIVMVVGTGEDGKDFECYALQRKMYWEFGWEENYFWGTIEQCKSEMDSGIKYDNRERIKVKYLAK